MVLQLASLSEQFSVTLIGEAPAFPRKRDNEKNQQTHASYPYVTFEFKVNNPVQASNLLEKILPNRELAKR